MIHIKHRIKWLISKLHFLPDAVFLRISYRLLNRLRLELQHPTRFNDKLNWLKLNMDGRFMARYVDKLTAREVAARTLGDDCLMPLLGVWDHPSKINWTRLGEKCVLKCTHGSHCGVVYDPATATPADRRAAIRKLHKWFARNWFWHGREPPYRWIRPRIIAEPWCEDAARNDYKVMCFDGEPRIIQHHSKADGGHKIDFYDRWGLRIPGMVKRGFPGSKRHCIDPLVATRLSRAARKIATAVTDPCGRPWPYVRVDLYLVRGEIRFGEITFFDSAALRDFGPDAINVTLGAMINLEPTHPERRNLMPDKLEAVLLDINAEPENVELMPIQNINYAMR